MPNTVPPAPATSAIRYKDVPWTAGVEDDMSAYQGPPSEENNRLWEDLFQCENS